MLGGLPVVAEFERRLDIAGVIDRLCPMRSVARATHGQVVEVLIANRLTSPEPLVHVQDWAGQWAVTEVYGVEADALNDDRIGRALDAIAPQLDQIVGSIGAGAIAEFGIDTARIHWDMTSMSLYGDYEDTQEGYPAPGYGHPKDRRVDLKQIQAGLAVTADGGIPVWHQCFDGGAGEVNQVAGAMTALRAMASPRAFLLVGDSKLVSYANLSAMGQAGLTYLAPASKTYVPGQVLAGLDLATATVVDYTAERDVGKPDTDRAVYRVVEDTMTLAGPRKKDPVLALRRVFVHSSGNAQAAGKARTKKITKATEDLGRLTRGLGTHHYRDAAAVTARVTVIAKSRRVGKYLRTHIDTGPSGQPTLTWHFDADALAAEAATDGWYALLTNLDAANADAGQVLIRYKGQQVVERRYGDFKGPLAVAPMFLQNNQRIAALITVICLALLLFSLTERAARIALAPEVKLPGLDRTTAGAKPTGRNLFTALTRLRIIPATHTTPPQVRPPTTLQTTILRLLAIDPTRPRWLDP